MISDALYSLKKYSIYHFDAEEAAMKKYGFYGYMQHKKEHNEFISKIDDLQNKLDNGKMVLALELANFLKEWLANHITVTDKAYSKFLTENGMK